MDTTWTAQLAAIVTDNPDPFDRLAAIQDLRSVIDQEERRAVAELRDAQWTWQAIADATGLNSRQRAEQKFHPARLFKA